MKNTEKIKRNKKKKEKEKKNTNKYNLKEK